MSDKILLKEEEAAELLSMSRHFLRRDRISENSVGLPFIRIGGAIRYRRADLEAWILEKSKITSVKSEAHSLETATPLKKGRGRPRKIDQIAARRAVD